jgi:large subunit ribosomal protein L9
MKVILLKDVDKLGTQGEVVNVKNGFGRNFLIPQGLARLATPSTIKHQEELLRQAARRISQEKDGALEVARQLEKEEIVIGVSVGEENRIFGTVTNQQVAVALAARGFAVDRRKIELDDEIRLTGVYSASVKLHPEVIGKVKIRVEPRIEAEPAS